MRKVLVLAYSAILLSGCDCKPTIPPKAAEDFLVTIMIDGEWSITNFTESATNYTQDYAGWRFKFYENKTVEAKLNTTPTYMGTWDGSTSSMTFSANFPGAAIPVSRIIGTWSVTATGSRVVEGTMTVGGITKVMKLYRE